jgi:ubiquinone/menaquinone biosynthesis C-methylase UbiE
VNPVSDVSRFGSIDQQPDPDHYIEFVDRANELPGFQEIEDRAVAELRLAPGGRILDLGCGTGEDTRRLAALVGPTGAALGVDASEAMIGVARRRTEGTGLPATFQLGDAAALDFLDAAFDATRCERLLVHMPEPATVLAEMVRVTRPGGRVVVIDLDFDMVGLDLPDADLTGGPSTPWATPAPADGSAGNSRASSGRPA